ncbi:MAG: ComEA family DNA-binding protein [Acidimicrobiia bacterium]|nr:ComEA family DNA-binding protein [Acidimicrobiia bacterium]
MDRLQWVVAGLVLLVAGMSGWWFGGEPAEPPPVEISRAGDSASLTVHVAGAVAGPGLVVVSPGSRVADAVAAAGGLLESADPAGLNLAAPVVDGQQIVVQTIGAAGTPPVDDGRVRLNSATASDLEAIAGVGPVLAARIVAYRESNGPFTEVEDLLDVAGIGESKLEAMRDQVIVP